MAISGNLVFQFTTGTGTGNLTLSAMTADTPAQYFRDCAAVFGTGSGNKFYYAIRHRTLPEWEVGIGYMLDATTMVRFSVIESSNANALVNFSAGIKDVVSDIPASIQNALVQGPTSATYRTVPVYDNATGKLLGTTNVTIDTADNLATPGKITAGYLETPDDALIQGGTTDRSQKGLVIQMIDGTTANAFEIQNNVGDVSAKFSTVGNGRLVLNYSGAIAAAAYPGFVLSVQNIGDSGEGSWIEILNSGGANTGAFFGMIGNQFQLFNWQGGDTEFWTFPTASNGYPRYTVSKEGNFAFDGTDQYGWSGGYGSGVGVLAVRNAKTVPSSGVSNVSMFYSEAGEMYTMSSDAVKTRLSNKVIALTDGSTPALNAKLGNVFTLSAAGDRTIAIPTNPTSGQRITIRHTASGANRTLALNTGTGGFRFGTDITALTVTTSGLTDYIECLYNATANKWDVIDYRKGY